MQNKKLNVIFAGTPDFSAKILKNLLSNFDINLVAIYTQPDRQAGRGKKLTPSEVKQVILEYNKNTNQNINIEQPLNFRKSNPDYAYNIQKLRSYNPDLIIVVAYGLILPKAVIDIPKYGCINIHTSLLPRWRGAAPIQRAILAGDQETGVTIQQIDTGLDTGDIIALSKCNILDADTTADLTDRLLDLSKPLLDKVIKQFITHTVTFTKQIETDFNGHSLVTYAHKLEKEEGLIDFNNDATFIVRQIKALNPWPGVKIKLTNNNFVKIGNARVISDNNITNNAIGKIIQSTSDGILIQCGLNKLLITELQFSGGKMISTQDALNGKFKNLLCENNNLSL